MTVTLHFQSTGTVPGNARPFRMLGGSLTVGRSDVNDLVLPDPDKMISGRHCAIEDQDGNIVVIDLSTNGTFLNYGKMPLGRTPTPLNDGDILSIGSYELMVEIPPVQAAPIADPLAAERVSFGSDTDMSDLADPLSDAGQKDDFLDGLLGEPMSGPAGVQREKLGDDGLLPPLGEDEGDFLKREPEQDRPAQSSHGAAVSDSMPTPAPATSAIPDDWDMDLELPTDNEDPFAAPDAASPKDAAPTPDAPKAPPPAPEPAAPPRAAPAPQPEVSAATATADTASAAFLEALGAGGMTIPAEEMGATMSRLGDVLRTMISGVREILMTRQSIKSEFRINQTVISAGANNPLKFSVSIDQAIAAMVQPVTKGYLPAGEAASQALDDIKAHEVAMMTGMEAALKGVLAQLDPQKLSERIAADSSLRSVLTNKKARYWDVFEAQYGKISDQAENDFHELFSKEFARAYQAQLERLKKK